MRRYFGAWEAVQRGPIRLVDAMGLLRIWKVREDTVRLNQLVVGAWRAQVHWVN